jgi:hypothetical protein
MFLCLYIYIFVCLFACACSYSLLVAIRTQSVCFALVNQRSNLGDQVNKLLEFHNVKDPEHLFGEGKCPLTYLYPIHMIIHSLALHN